MTSLAEQLYVRWLRGRWADPWEELSLRERATWEAVALEACRLISSDLAVIVDGYASNTPVREGMRHAIALIGVHDVHAHAEERLRGLARLGDLALRFVNAEHTGDANCRAGDCDSCEARMAERELRLAVDAYETEAIARRS